jgi:hypothetical protein
MTRSMLVLRIVALSSLVACADQTPTAPVRPRLSSSSGSGGSVQEVRLRDACDPATFDAVLGPGACVKDGSVTFDEFIAELTEKRAVGAWKNNPDQFGARVGVTLEVANIGGEVHTFTRVASFGGGIVPLLNDLSGNPAVAPECTQLTGVDFIAAGGTVVIRTGTGMLGAGTHRFQCCIHPWMRTTATLQKS